MCAPLATLAVVGFQAASGAYQAYNQYQSGLAAQNFYNYQAQQSELEGKTAVERAGKQSELIQDTAKFEGKKQASEYAQISASQRAALAANGIPLSSGTAGDIALDTANKSKMDELAIRYNADVKSWENEQGARDFNWQSQNQAQQYRYAGSNAKAAAKRNAMATILGTAASTALTFAGAGGFKPLAPKLSLGSSQSLRNYYGSYALK